MSQRQKWQPTSEEFEAFLAWLDSDPAQASEKYLLIDRKLNQYFANRQCPNADQLTDKTIDRMIQKLPAIADEYEGDPMRYIHRVAHYIFLEYQHEVATRPVAVPTPINPDEEDHRCLESCLNELKPEDKEFMLAYYQYDGQEKIEFHRKMAEERGLEIGALRNRVHRLRKTLAPCIQQCLEKN